ncbi:MAG: cyclic nucleotide-binding domain-containing protein [Thermodesulfovibrionales bacterium]
MKSNEILREQILFENLSEEELRRIKGLLNVVTFKKGDSIFAVGEETRGIFLIQSGRVEIFKSTVDGWKQTLSVLGPGSFFGELSIIEDRRHEANAVAMEDSELFLIAKEDFKRIEKEDLELAVKILKKLVTILSKNLRQMNEVFLKAIVSY